MTAETVQVNVLHPDAPRPSPAVEEPPRFGWRSLVEPSLLLAAGTGFLVFMGLVESEAYRTTLGIPWDLTFDPTRYAVEGFKTFGVLSVTALLAFFLLRRWARTSRHAVNLTLLYVTGQFFLSDVFVLFVLLGGDFSWDQAGQVMGGMRQTLAVHGIVFAVVLASTLKGRPLEEHLRLGTWKERFPWLVMVLVLTVAHAHDTGTADAINGMHLGGLPDVTLQFKEAGSPLDGATLMLLMEHEGRIYLAERFTDDALVRSVYVVSAEDLRSVEVRPVSLSDA